MTKKKNTSIDIHHQPKSYRLRMKYSNLKKWKEFLSSKDIVPSIDLIYIEALKQRVIEIINLLNVSINPFYRLNDIDKFIETNIVLIVEQIILNEHYKRMNNQGRRIENVIFSWLRGYVVASYFINTLKKTWQTNFIPTGGDNPYAKEMKDFCRTSTADFEFSYQGEIWRLEFQSGFQGINDIKKSKFEEAKKQYTLNSQKTVCVHVDLFNGRIGFILLHTIAEDQIQWIKNPQMEGQEVYQIEEKYFRWQLLEEPKNVKDILK